jgi:hypothetical protein
MKTRVCRDPARRGSADLGLEHGLAIADAVGYAAPLVNRAELVTSDSDSRALPGVTYLV